MDANNIKIIMILEKIAQGRFLSQTIARDLESTILEAYPDADNDGRFENVLHMLASYEPTGGDYLYNEKQLKEECKSLLALLIIPRKVLQEGN